MFSIELDVVISEYLVDKFKHIFKYIHPNLFTITGIVLNYFIYKYLNTKEIIKNKSKEFYLCMFLRWVCDCLDGTIARKFNKVSKYGHYLDTLSDILLGLIFSYYIQKNIFNFSFNSVLFINVILIFIFNYYTSFLTTHDKIKNKHKSDNIIYKLLGLIINNSYLNFIFIIILSKIM